VRRSGEDRLGLRAPWFERPRPMNPQKIGSSTASRSSFSITASR
jgi:hypothetical protein